MEPTTLGCTGEVRLSTGSCWVKERRTCRRHPSGQLATGTGMRGAGLIWGHMRTQCRGVVRRLHGCLRGCCCVQRRQKAQCKPQNERKKVVLKPNQRSHSRIRAKLYVWVALSPALALHWALSPGSGPALAGTLAPVVPLPHTTAWTGHPSQWEARGGPLCSGGGMGAS